MMIDKNL